MSEHGIIENVLNTLAGEQVTGHMLVDLSEDDLKDSIGLLQSRNIKRIVKNFVDKLEEPKVKEKATLEKTRDFGQSVKDLIYTQGNFIQHEAGPANLLEPAREAKLFESSDDNVVDMTIPFVQRVGKFAIACLNRRCNGTIYFGVGDSRPIKINQKEHMHCEIVGMNITADQVEHFEDAIKSYLRGEGPICFKKINNIEMKKAVDLCISPIRVIPIKGSTKIVLEIDIEPSSIRCRDLVFQIQLPRSNGKPQDLSYYERNGAHSDQIKKTGVKLFLEKTCQMNMNERRDLENQKNLRYADTSVKLDQLLCRSENYINDEDLNFFLITDVVPENLLLTESVQWIQNIEWKGIFDFDASSQDAGLSKFITPSMQLKQPKHYHIKNLANLIENESLDSVRKEISFGDRSIWLQCNDKEQEYNVWALESQDSIRSDHNYHIVLIRTISAKFLGSSVTAPIR